MMYMWFLVNSKFYYKRDKKSRVLHLVKVARDDFFL